MRGGDLKKKIVLILLFCGLLVFPGYAEEPDVPATARHILNLWCESKIVGDKSFDLDGQIQKAVNGEEVPAFTSWDLFLAHVALAQADKKNPPRVKFGTLYVFSESRRRATAYLMELASQQMVPILGGIQQEADVRLKKNSGYGDRFKFVLAALNDARDMMNSGQELLDKSQDRDDFDRLKQYVTNEIDAYEDLVVAAMDRVYAWANPRDDKKKKRKAERNYAIAQANYEKEIKWGHEAVIGDRLDILNKYGLGRSYLAHGGNLLDRYAAKLIKSEKQYGEKYL